MNDSSLTREQNFAFAENDVPHQRFEAAPVQSPADTNLTRGQARALLEKLAQDDGFRALFESAPARALHALGVDAETIVGLPAECLRSKEVAPKEHYADLLASCADAAISSAMLMTPPRIGFKAR